MLWFPIHLTDVVMVSPGVGSAKVAILGQNIPWNVFYSLLVFMGQCLCNTPLIQVSTEESSQDTGMC